MAEKERILVVDDEPSIRKYLQTLLEVDGYQRGNGELAARKRSRRSGRRAPRFHHSGRADAGDERAGHAAAIDADGPHA